MSPQEGLVSNVVSQSNAWYIWFPMDVGVFPGLYDPHLAMATAWFFADDRYAPADE